MKMRCPLLFPHLAPMPPPPVRPFSRGIQWGGDGGPTGAIAGKLCDAVGGRNLAVSTELAWRAPSRAELMVPRCESV